MILPLGSQKMKFHSRHGGLLGQIPEWHTNSGAGRSIPRVGGAVVWHDARQMLLSHWLPLRDGDFALKCNKAYEAFDATCAFADEIYFLLVLTEAVVLINNEHDGLLFQHLTGNDCLNDRISAADRVEAELNHFILCLAVNNVIAAAIVVSLLLFPAEVADAEECDVKRFIQQQSPSI
jgi:hypothetical protein